MKKTISICAWCDKDKKQTIKAMLEGFEITHGVCEKCKLEFLNGLTSRAKDIQSES